MKQSQNKNKFSGFTLIELLVVISIIGLLASVVLVSLNSARVKAKIAKTQADMSQFVKVSQIAEGESGKNLGQITGNYCSACSACWGGGNLQNVPTSHLCYVRWLNVLTTVQTAATGVGGGIAAMTRDGWGSPYVVDENEGEGGSCVYLDSFCSAGADGLSSTGDDICMSLPSSGNCR